MASHESTWRAKGICDGATTLEEMAQRLEEAAAELREMAADGVILFGEVEDDYANLETSNAAAAMKHGFRKDSYE